MSKVIKTISVLPNWTKNENKNPKDLRYKAVAEIQLLSNELGVSKNLSEFIQTFEILAAEKEITNYKKTILKGIVEDYLELVNGSKRRELWEGKTEWEKIAIFEILISNHKLFKGAWDLAGSSDIADILNEIYQDAEQREQIEETVESLETLKELEISNLKEKALKELNKNMTISQTELIEKLNELINPRVSLKDPINVDSLVNDLVEKWEEKQNDIRLLNENLVELEEQITRLEKVIRKNEEETKNLVGQLTRLAQEKEELSENLESEIILRQEKEAVIEEFEENKKLNEEKIAELELGKTTLENSLAQLNSKINTLQKRVNHLEEEELPRTLKEKKELKEIVDANRGEINDAKINAQKAIESQSTLINRHKEEIEQKNKEIERITEKSIEQLGELENVKAELNRVKKTISELEKEAKNQKEQISKYVFTQSDHVEAQAENIKLEENLNKIAKDVDKISNQSDLEETINNLKEEKKTIEETSEKYRIQVSSLKEQLKRWGIEDRDFDLKNSWWNKIAKISEVEKWKFQHERAAKELGEFKKKYQEVNFLLVEVKTALGIRLGELDNNNLDGKKIAIVGKIKDLQGTISKLKIYREAIVKKFGSQENGETIGEWQEKLANLVNKEEIETPAKEENLLAENIKTLLGLEEGDDLPNDWQHKLIRINDLVKELKIEKETKTDKELKGEILIQLKKLQSIEEEKIKKLLEVEQQQSEKETTHDPNQEKEQQEKEAEINKELKNETDSQKTEIIKLKEQKKNTEKVNITLGILLFISIVGLVGILIRSNKKNSGIKRQEVKDKRKSEKKLFHKITSNA